MEICGKSASQFLSKSYKLKTIFNSYSADLMEWTFLN